MLHEGDIKLWPLAEGDSGVMAALAINKKVWDNLCDFFPHPAPWIARWTSLGSLAGKYPADFPRGTFTQLLRSDRPDSTT